MPRNGDPEWGRPAPAPQGIRDLSPSFGRDHLADGETPGYSCYWAAGRVCARRARLQGAAGAGGQHVPMVAEKMTMPSTFMPSLVPGSDL